MQGFLEFFEEKKITVKTKMGGEIPATIKVTGKDYHIVKTASGKQYKVDHQGNSLEEEIELSEEQLDELKKSTLASYAKKSASQLPTHQTNATLKHTGPIANAHSGKHPKTGESPVQYDDRKVRTRQQGIIRAVDKLAKEEVELEEAKTPAQKRDFQTMMAGGMSRDDYNKKHGLGKYAEKSGKSKLDPTGVYHNLIKGVKEETDKDLPFTPDKPHKPVAKSGKFGSAYSTVRHLARQAMQKQAKKLNKEEGDKISIGEEALIEKLDKKEDLRAALDRHTEHAIAANKRGDDEAVKVHQGYINKIKNKMAKMVRTEEVEPYYKRHDVDAEQERRDREEDETKAEREKTELAKRTKMKEEVELEEGKKGYAPGWMLKADPELAKKVKANTQGFKDLKKYAGKDIPKKEEVELQEASDAHKVMVTVSDPHHTMVTKRKEQIMKHVIVRAGDKGDAQAKAEAFYKKRGYKVHGSEYHSKQPATSMKTEGN